MLFPILPYASTQYNYTTVMIIHNGTAHSPSLIIRNEICINPTPENLCIYPTRDNTEVNNTTISPSFIIKLH